ncbi:DoxX family protein [Glycomyces harbinensis]|uniref:DoxX-like family protein n=1 Tax=Glycomyces harbinensis TaxID=58114 RepID=A0A1G6XFE7_9ACTN|nr:DoxX family protein [Glycomyces harbinensis]SDD76890.1 DoxX-like family protein [Glycomyces harbinensis]
MITLASLPDPVWPVVLLAAIQFGDGLMSLRPVPFIARCFTAVEWPREYWWTMPVLKFAATAGLIAGIWVPYLGLLTSIGLVAYFITAIAMHVRAKDLGRNLFLNATGMLLVCTAVTWLSFTGHRMV